MRLIIAILAILLTMLLSAYPACEASGAFRKGGRAPAGRQPRGCVSCGPNHQYWCCR